MNPVLRASPRYPVSLRVAFSDGDGTRVNEATSLSVGGMFVRTDRELPVGALVPVALELPDGDPPLPVQAKVLYSSGAPKARARTTGHGFGVQFVAEDATFRERAGDFCRPFRARKISYYRHGPASVPQRANHE